jgi:hypothetical protein
MRVTGLGGALVLLLMAAVQGGCSDPAITLTAAKAQLCAGGYDKTEVTAQVKLSGGSTKSGLLVTFTLSGEGSLASDPVTPLTYKEVSTDADGEATVTVYAGRNAGVEATLTAEFYDDDSGDSASATLTIPFVPPQPGCGGAPTSRSLSLRCDALNIGAFRTPIPDIAVPCYVEAATHDGQKIPAEAMDIDFLLEAGSMEAQTDYDGHRFFLYRPTGGVRTQPKAVSPSAALLEPSRFDSNGVERCPRQGLVTLVAVVRGEESWVDTNGNGVFDIGVDTFDDIAEPFVDMDDSGDRDSDEDFVDFDGDGSYSDANGQWDADTKIWAVTHILWTGAPVVEQKSGDAIASHYTLSAQSTSITAPGSLTVSLFLRDENMNPVAGFDGIGSTDYVEFLTNDYVITLNPITRPITNQLGFSVDSDGAIVGDSFLGDAPFRVTLNTIEGYTGAYTLTFSMTASPGPSGADGYFVSQITEAIPLQVTGQVK